MTISRLSFLCTAILFVFTVGVSYGAESAAAGVLRVDQTRIQAMMAGDASALSGVFSETLTFVHSDGRIETKADYVKNLLAGDTAYTEVQTSDVRALEPSTDVVVLMGAQKMKKRLGTVWSDISLRFMSVWKNENGTWRMIAWQSMRPSGNSVVPRP